MTEEIKNILKDAFNFEKIVWIDDLFAENTDTIETDNKIQNLIDLVEGMIDSGKNEILKQVFDCIDFDQPTTQIISDIKTEAEGGELDLNRIFSVLGMQIDNNASEFTQEQVNTISDALNSISKLEKYSLTKWNQEAQELLNNENNILFLVDKEFTNEGGDADTGVVIINKILSKTKNNPKTCILFTHSCRDDNEEESARINLLSKINDNGSIPGYGFQVLSKSKISMDKGESNILLTLTTLVLRRTFAKMTYGMKEIIDSTLSTLIDNLMSIDINEIESAFFDSTRKEGVGELDLLNRIYQVKHRQVVYELMKKTDIIKNIVAFRKLKQTNIIDFKSKNKVSNSYLKALRKREFWSEKNEINETFSPVSNGDVFNINGNEFILLAQPCEIAIRSNGTRGASIGVLAPITQNTTKKPNSKDIERGILHSLSMTNIKNDKENTWTIDFKESFYVNIGVLDFCSFNEEGKLYFSKFQTKPEIINHVGLGMRFDKYRDILTERPDDFHVKLKIECFDCMKLEDMNDFVMEMAEVGYFTANIQRVRKLEEPYSEVVLNKYHLYKSRKGFDHDYIGS